MLIELKTWLDANIIVVPPWSTPGKSHTRRRGSSVTF